MSDAETRTASISRRTNETDVAVSINIDGTGASTIETGVGFFDHMLDQLSRHSLIDMQIRTKGDLHVDDHHTVEDTGIAIGQALARALGDRKGITRYASLDLAMDETMTKAAVDVSGRPFLVWNVTSSRRRSAPSTPNWCANSSRRSPSMPASRCMCRTSTAPTTIISPRPASRPLPACCAPRRKSILARPDAFPPRRARSPEPKEGHDHGPLSRSHPAGHARPG